MRNYFVPQIYGENPIFIGTGLYSTVFQQKLLTYQFKSLII